MIASSVSGSSVGSVVQTITSRSTVALGGSSESCLIWPYILGLDENNDGKISVNVGGSITNVMEPVIMMSGGADPSDSSRGIYSWE